MFSYKFLVCKILHFSILILLTSNNLISQDDISKDIFSEEKYETPYLFNNNQLKPAKEILLKKVLNIGNWGLRYHKQLEELKKEQQKRIKEEQEKKKKKKLSKTEESNYRDRVKKELQEKLKNLFQDEDGNKDNTNETPKKSEQEDNADNGNKKTHVEKVLLEKKKPKQPKLQKIISLIQKNSQRLPDLFKTKVKKKELLLNAEIDKNIQKIQYQVDVFSKISIKKVLAEYNDYRKEIDKKMMETNLFNLPDEVWKNCRYNYKGLWILDMSVPYWENLSVAEQKEYARIYRNNYAKYIKKPKEKLVKKNGINIVMVLIPPGRFWMGSPADEIGRNSDEKRHKVIIAKPFYIGKYEITQQQWEKVVNYNPSYFQGAYLPVERVSWFDCFRFCSKMGVRLPTEEEWEYSCRAGTTTPFNLGFNINAKEINYNGNYPYLKQEVELFRKKTVSITELTNPNAWGCYNFHGNIWEWCEDWYNDYTEDKKAEELAQIYRIARGGGWSAYASTCRSASRSKNEPGFRFIYLGFRIALTIK